MSDELKKIILFCQRISNAEELLQRNYNYERKSDGSILVHLERSDGINSHVSYDQNNGVQYYFRMSHCLDEIWYDKIWQVKIKENTLIIHHQDIKAKFSTGRDSKKTSTLIFLNEEVKQATIETLGFYDAPPALVDMKQEAQVSLLQELWKLIEENTSQLQTILTMYKNSQEAQVYSFFKAYKANIATSTQAIKTMETPKEISFLILSYLG